MGTLSSNEHCPSFVPTNLLGQGLIKIAIEPKNLLEMPLLVEGLKKLDRSDPSVTFSNEKGQYIISTCGQVHLERCLQDLKDQYAGIEITCSDPIVTFKETVTHCGQVLKAKPEEKMWFELIKEKEEEEKEEGEEEEKKKEVKEKQEEMMTSDDMYVNHVQRL